MQKNTIFILIIILAIAGAAYFFYMGSQGPESETLRADTNPEVQASANRVVSLLNQIKSLKIDGSLFKSAEYKTLQDYSVPIPAVEVGRINPFAPLPGSAPAPTRTSAPSTRR